MISSSPSKPSASSRPDRPIWSEPGLAIWARRNLSPGAPDITLKLEDDFGSRFFAGVSRQSPLYLSLYSEISYGPKITAPHIAALVRGEEVKARFRSRGAEPASYEAYLAISEIQSFPWKNDPTKMNRILRVGRAFPLLKKDEGKAKQWGWQVDQIVFPSRIKHGTAYFSFDPSHAFQCLKLGHCRVQNYEIAYAGAVQKEGQPHASAKLHVSLLSDERAQSAAFKPHFSPPQL